MSILQEALRRKQEESGVPPSVSPPPLPRPPPPQRRSGAWGPAILLVVIALLGWMVVTRAGRTGASGPTPSASATTSSPSVARAEPPSSAPPGPVQRAREAVAAANLAREEVGIERIDSPKAEIPPREEVASWVEPPVPAPPPASPAAPAVRPPMELHPPQVASIPSVPSPAVPVGKSDEVAWPELQIRGIVSGPGGTPTVMLGGLGMFECGETIPGTEEIRIDAIETDRLILRKGDATRVYRMGKR